MKVLSIDLDYIMGKSIHLYEDIGWEDDPIKRWKNYFNEVEEHQENLCIDEKNLYYCFSIFLKAIKHCNNVVFAYNHDSILDDLINFDKIELINIDHHDDVLYHKGYVPNDDDPENSIKYMKCLYETYESIKNNYSVDEGNWISLLNIENKLSSYIFIGNEDSVEVSDEKISFINKHFPETKFLTRDQYTFKDYKFDYIFVCLSPQFIPPFHWHYFSMFLTAYESLTGNLVDYDRMPIRYFTNNYRYSDVKSKIIL